MNECLNIDNFVKCINPSFDYNYASMYLKVDVCCSMHIYKDVD